MGDSLQTEAGIGVPGGGVQRAKGRWPAIPTGAHADELAPAHDDNGAGLGGLGCLHAVPDGFHIHQSQTPLQELWIGIRSGVLKQDDAIAEIRHHGRGTGLRRLLGEEWKREVAGACGVSLKM